MGASLAAGTVDGDRLRCPLHAWEFRADGRCENVRSERVETFPVREAHGLLFLHTADGSSPLPAFEGRYRFVAGAPVFVRAPWATVISNGFDVSHLASVHRRELLEPAEAGPLDAHRFRLRTVTRAIGHGLSDRIMNVLSGGRIESGVTAWGGSVLTVESRVRRHAAALLVGFTPVSGGTWIHPLFGATSRAAASLSRYLFTSFLSRDLALLDDLDLKPRFVTEADEPLRRFFRYLDSLPALPHGLAIVPNNAGDRAARG